MAARESTTNSTRRLAYQALERVEKDAGYVDIVLSQLLERSQFSVKDRAFVTEIVRGVVRWKKKLNWIVDQLFTGKPDQLDERVRWILWIGLYQLEFMRTPVFASVNESVNLAKAHKLFRWTGVINGILRNFARAPEKIQFPDRNSNPVAWLAVTESHPEWLVKRWIDQLGLQDATALCGANNTVPFLSVRPNTLRISEDEFVHVLSEAKVDFRPSKVAGFYEVAKIEFDLRDTLLREGLMTIQDASAGLPVLLAAPQAGQLVFDLCAAPGGKSTYAAELMRDTGIVVSGDLNKARAGLVIQAAKRLSLDAINVVVADARHFPAQKADIVFLDAPCSGLGVLGKKIDVRWKKDQTDLVQLAALQSELIGKAADLVRPGGTLVYSTCTIEKSENEDVVQSFLEHNQSFELSAPHKSIEKSFITDNGFVRTWPHLHKMDGSFSAKLIKRK